MCDADDIQYRYRFVTLNDTLLYKLKQACGVCQVRSLWNEDIQGYVVSVALLNEEVSVALLGFISSNNLSSTNHGVYISIVSDSDQAGFTAPNHILRLLRETSGSLDVSFTMV